MKKRIATIITLVFVVALCVGLFVACDTTSKTVITPNRTDGGTTQTISGVDCLQSFSINTVKDMTAEDFAKYYTVTEYVTASAVKVNVAKRGVGQFVINAPTEGYELNKSYKIALRSGATFTEYPTANALAFTVTTNYLSKAEINAGVVEYEKGHAVQLSQPEVGKEVVDGFKYDVNIDEYGVERGIFRFNTKGAVEFEPNQVFVLKDNTKQKKEAFKVVQTNKVSANIVEVVYEKPNMSEIYSEFEYADNGKGLNENYGEIDFTYDSNGTRTLENSALSKSIVQTFGIKPEFNLSPSIVTDSNGNKIVRVVVTITLPGVVKTDNASANLSIVIENDLLVTTKTVVKLADVAEAIKDANFNLNANIKNDTTCKVVIDVRGGYQSIINAQDLLNKLHQVQQNQNGGDSTMTNEEINGAIDEFTGIADPANREQNGGAESSVCVPIFRWTLPLAAGALAISYNADLAFRFDFAGSFEIAVKGSIEYDIDVSYTRNDGVKVTATNVKEEDAFIDSVSMTLSGVATVKIGIIQKLGLNILAGVLNIEVQAEVGNYNRIYGFATTSNLVKQSPDIVGAIYFEGGFYYDVDLVLAVRIGSFLTIADTNIGIVDGEIRLYEAGNQDLELSVNEIKKFETKSFVSTLPDYTVVEYNLVSRSKTNKVIEDRTLIDYTIIEGGEGLEINNNGVMTVAPAYRNQQVNARIKVVYTNKNGHKFPAVYTDIVYDGRALALDEQDFNFDKASYDDIVIGVSMADESAIPAVKDANSNVVPSLYDSATQTLTIKNIDLCRLDTGVNNLKVWYENQAIYEAPININISGMVSLFKDVVDGKYQIYCPDQIIELTTTDFANIDGKLFELASDIDMRNKVINPISKFSGVLDGKGCKIYNFNINSLKDYDAGFVAVNTGEIKDIAFVGNVDLTVPGKFKKTYNIGGVVGTNLGKLTNVSFDGLVKVYSKSLNTALTYNIGGIAGVVDEGGSINNCVVTQETKVRFEAMLGLLGVHIYAGAITSAVGGDAIVECVANAGAQTFLDINIAQ